MARLALPPPSAYGLRWRQRQPRHQGSAASACARSSFRALKSKFPAARCLIFIGTEGRLPVSTDRPTEIVLRRSLESTLASSVAVVHQPGAMDRPTFMQSLIES